MKLNDYETKNVYQLLSYVMTKELVSLARTVTKNVLPVGSAEEALKVIILHEKDLATLLSRQKVTKEVLLKYLHENNVEISASNAKSSVVESVLQFWKQHATQQLVPGNLFDETCITSDDGQQIEVDKFAAQFSEWFYKMLNDRKPDQIEIIGKEHFWNDCSMQLLMDTCSQNIVREVYKDSSNVVKLLSEVIQEQNLYFNPNISNFGTKGKVESHGLAKVMTCGTLHQVDNCVGVFEQYFGLVKDPFMENNWRIKSTCLRLKATVVLHEPILTCDVNQIALPSTS